MQSLIVLFLFIFFFGSSDNQLLGSAKQKVSDSKVAQQALFFKEVPTSFTHEQMVTDVKALLSACRDGLLNFSGKRRALVRSEIFKVHGIKPSDVEKTLKFMIKTIEQDLAKKRPQRIANPQFLSKHFRCIQWFGDTKTAQKNGVIIPQWPDGGVIAPDKIRLTCYAAFTAPGRSYKSKEFNCALYELLGGEAQENQTKKLFTKQQVVAGVLELPVYRKKVKPMVYITRHALEEALMQGSLVVIMPDGEQRVFNVYKNNEILYDKTIPEKDKMLQKRYWYFKEISHVHGGVDRKEHLRILTQGGAVVAGNIDDLGKSKLIALQYQNPITKKNELRLVVLQDQGGAFKDNLYGLDLFMGIFDSRDAFKEKIRNMPNTSKAYFLIKK